MRKRLNAFLGKAEIEYLSHFENMMRCLRCLFMKTYVTLLIPFVKNVLNIATD
jgi:membrane-anchored glycerophosphoryl diester phosphodiesterase (GDPDase)